MTILDDLGLTEADLHAAVRDEPLAPGSPGFGAGTAPRVPLADPIAVLDASSERRRREAVLGRTTAGTKGDADLGGLGVSESAIAARLATAERLLEVAQAAVLEHGEAAHPAYAMALHEIDEADAAYVAAGLHTREAEPVGAFRSFLAESGDHIYDLLED